MTTFYETKNAFFPNYLEYHFRFWHEKDILFIRCTYFQDTTLQNTKYVDYNIIFISDFIK